MPINNIIKELHYIVVFAVFAIRNQWFIMFLLKHMVGKIFLTISIQKHQTKSHKKRMNIEFIGRIVLPCKSTPVNVEPNKHQDNSNKPNSL